MLSHILPGKVQNKREMDWASKGELIEFNQNGPASMDPKAYVFVPDSCLDGGCPIHVAFHGCSQSKSSIGKEYLENTGYLEWAASNNLIVLFPQSVKNPPLNMNGCWDFWGFTGSDYASKDGE